jgi:hypothetical protein
VGEARAGPEGMGPEVSETDHFCTPPEAADPLHRFFGGEVGCDPCSNPTSIIRARVAYTIGGLHLPWGVKLAPKKQRTAYSNPPYSVTAPWIGCGLRQIDVGNVAELLYLVMAVPSNAWWRKACAYRINPRIIITKRLAFIDPKIPPALPGAKPVRREGARFETALIYYGTRHAELDREFKDITSWSTWGRSEAACQTMAN